MSDKTINAVIQFKTTPEYAREVISAIRGKGLTMNVIARKAGLNRRTLYRAMQMGFANFPTQFVMEALAGRR